MSHVPSEEPIRGKHTGQKGPLLHTKYRWSHYPGTEWSEKAETKGGQYSLLTDDHEDIVGQHRDTAQTGVQYSLYEDTVLAHNDTDGPLSRGFLQSMTAE